MAASTGPAPKPKKRRRNVARTIAWLFFAVGLFALIGFAAWPTPITVETAPVTRGALVVSVDEAGRARVRDRYVVGAPLAGELARIELHPGDALATGAVLARIVPASSPLLDTRSHDEATARVGSASAALASAQAGVVRAELASKHAEEDLEKARKLAAAGAAPGDTVEHAELEARLRASELVSARFAAQVAGYEVKIANAVLARGDAPAKGGAGDQARDRFEITAPIGGRVLRVLQESAGVVAPGTPLVEIGDPARLEIVVDVLSADAARVREGARATLESWGGAPLAAKVRLVEPSAFTRISALGVEEQRVHLVLDLLDARERWTTLGDSYRVEAKIVVEERKDALLVPAGAIFRRGDEWAVFVLSQGRTRLRTIKTGARNARVVEVVAGLTEGEQVVVHPSERVEEGARAKAR
jgi:HlyD family secretion protein